MTDTPAIRTPPIEVASDEAVTGLASAQVVYITVELPGGSESFFLPGGVEFEVVEDTLVIRGRRTDEDEDDHEERLIGDSDPFRME